MIACAISFDKLSIGVEIVVPITSLDSYIVAGRRILHFMGNFSLASLSDLGRVVGGEVIMVCLKLLVGYNNVLPGGLRLDLGLSTHQLDYAVTDLGMGAIDVSNFCLFKSTLRLALQILNVHRTSGMY